MAAVTTHLRWPILMIKISTMASVKIKYWSMMAIIVTMSTVKAQAISPACQVRTGLLASVPSLNLRIIMIRWKRSFRGLILTIYQWTLVKRKNKTKAVIINNIWMAMDFLSMTNNLSSKSSVRIAWIWTSSMPSTRTLKKIHLSTSTIWTIICQNSTQTIPLRMQATISTRESPKWWICLTSLMRCGWIAKKIILNKKTWTQISKS